MNNGAMGSVLFSDNTLKYSAGGYQLLSDIWQIPLDTPNRDRLIDEEIASHLIDLQKGYYLDNPGDAKQIQKGIDVFWRKYGNEF